MEMGLVVRGLILLCACAYSVTSQTQGAWQQQHSGWTQLEPGNRHVFASGQRLSKQPPTDAQRVSLPAISDGRRPRRGHIVRRIHASSLNIPALHSRYQSLAPSQNSPSPSECSELCPPPWMSFVDNLRGQAENITEPMCTFAEHFSACSAPNEICRTDPVKFRCCPSHCVQSAMSCYRGQPTEYLCVPKTIQPWMRKMFRLLG